MYSKTSYWKILLALAAIVIVCVTLGYSNYLANQLALKEDQEAELYSKAMTIIFQNQDLNAQIGLEFEIIENSNIPVIAEDELGNLIGNNFGEENDNDQDFLLEKKQELLDAGFEPILGEGYASKVYYTRTKLYHHIRFFPILQILLVASFIWIGFAAFRKSKRDEQNRVWAGMAKETAHQLGTPLSAIIAWLENLKLTTDGKVEQEEIIAELENDVGRLELIADRFSKIGSIPELVEVNLVDVLWEAQDYMSRRAPRRVSFHFPARDSAEYTAKINIHLFHWVIENLIRNALDAMDGQGKISGEIYEDKKWVYIDITDTGKGIPGNKQKTIFEPGYSTKTRGWGLGLSLAKRIIQNYHSGKIFVKSSKMNVGTVFTIQLPK